MSSDAFGLVHVVRTRVVQQLATAQKRDDDKAHKTAGKLMPIFSLVAFAPTRRPLLRHKTPTARTSRELQYSIDKREVHPDTCRH